MVQVSSGGFANHSPERGMESALGARTASHANLARGHHQERTTLERFSVFLEDSIELVDLGVQVCSWEPKEDDAGVLSAFTPPWFSEAEPVHSSS
jgi:hypothetical protein